MEDNVLQPVSFHSLPPLVAESLAHSAWRTGVLDMTPGSGELMKTKVLSGSGGYLGICATVEQRDFLLKILKAKILQQMECPDSKVYCPGYAKKAGNVQVGNVQVVAKKAAAKPETEAKSQVQPKPKRKNDSEDQGQPQPSKTQARQASGAGAGLSEALQKMLAAAKGKEGGDGEEK